MGAIAAMGRSYDTPVSQPILYETTSVATSSIDKATRTLSAVSNRGDGG